MRFIEAISHYPATPIFGRIEGLESDSDEICDWELDAIDAPILEESEISEFFIVKAKHVLPDGTIQDCYIDLCLPERISDYAYFPHGSNIDCYYYHECEGEVICAVPINCFGNYELFYSRTEPNVGIEILKQGLNATNHKQHIAEDLGYILRDENRFLEAAEMFQLATEDGPSSYFIYGEIASCFDEIGDTVNAKKYYALFNAAQ